MAISTRRYQQFYYSFIRGLTSIHGYADTDAAGVVTSYSIPGVASFTQSGVGEYTIVLNTKWNAVMSLEFQLLSATAQDLVPQVKSINLSTKTIVVSLLTAGSPTDVTSAVRIYMRALFRSSSVVR